MSPKNLNAPNKTHSLLFKHLKKKQIFDYYKKFESNLGIQENFIVAVSGGPDSLALSYLAKIYSLKKKLNIKFFIVDHKLRKKSTEEAKFVKKKLKQYSMNLNVLTWVGKKPKKNIQSIARNKRYSLIIDKAKKLKIKNILLGHHKDDLFENFFIRILRGSGLNGLVSLEQKTQIDKVSLLRPLLNFNKQDLIYISNNVFESFVEDPSNKDDKFKRVRIRNFLRQLEIEGMDKNKFLLTIKNLKYANKSIKFYTKKNLEDNAFFLKNKNSYILKKDFVNHPHEIVFRSLSEIIKRIGKKYYPMRGKKIDKLIELINTKPSFKVTLGDCVIKKVNESVIVSKEY